MKYFIWIILFISCFFPQAQASRIGLFASDMTMKEINSNVERLKEEKNSLDERSKQVQKENWELSSFLRRNLSQTEITEIADAVAKYQSDRLDIERDLTYRIENNLPTDTAKKILLEIQLEFYKYLAKFVDSKKKQDFIEHIKFNIQSTKERKDLIEEISKMESILDEKVIYFREQIELHKEVLQVKIETSITDKIAERIDAIDADPKYKDLSKSVKNRIYQNFILQIQQKQKELSESNFSESYKKTRNLIFDTMIKKIEEKMK